LIKNAREKSNIKYMQFVETLMKKHVAAGNSIPNTVNRINLYFGKTVVAIIQ